MKIQTDQSLKRILPSDNTQLFEMSPFNKEKTKDILKWRFKSGERYEGNLSSWYKYLLYRDDIERRDKLFAEWSILCQKAKSQKIPVQAIRYETPLDEIERRIKYLKGMI